MASARASGMQRSGERRRRARWMLARRGGRGTKAEGRKGGEMVLRARAKDCDDGQRVSGKRSCMVVAASPCLAHDETL